jgi:anti-sigma-K factor RskA
VNVQEYISSGIVESYVLGLASDKERSEFEQLCRQYPEVLKARTDFEQAFEQQAMQNAVAPDPDLKSKIWNEIKEEGKVIQLDTTAKAKRVSWAKYAAAAAVIFLGLSLYWNISLFNKNQELKKNYDVASGRIKDLENDMQVLQQNPTIKMASLKGMDASPQSFATVYWDTASHDVYLLANNLPVPPGDKQYQLWALLDGQPIDLGMLDYDIKQKKLLVRMKNAQKAQAFAITLEKKDRGDVSKPQGAMYVMGNL